jgi:hypothetical protein
MKNGAGLGFLNLEPVLLPFAGKVKISPYNHGKAGGYGNGIS